MTSQLIAYRVQIFCLSLSFSLFIFQLEPIMINRGISSSTAISVYSIAQILTILATMLWSKLVLSSSRGYVIIRVGILLRLATIAIMCFHVDNTIFIEMVLLYNTVASSIDIVNEGQIMNWAAEDDANFGRIRLFGSFGYSISGIVTSLLLLAFGTIDSVLYFALFINAAFLIMSLYRPVKLKAAQQKNNLKRTIKFDASLWFLICLVSLMITIPNSFGVIMNLHYRNELGTSFDVAVFWSGIAILLSAGISEMSAFFYIDRLLNKLGAKKVIMIGMYACIIRWIIAAFCIAPWTFTATFLFHGISFCFIYMGFMMLVRIRYGNDAIGKALSSYMVLVSVMTALLTQLFNLVLVFATSTTILILFVFLSSAICAAFYLGFWNNRKYDEQTN